MGCSGNGRRGSLRPLWPQAVRQPYLLPTHAGAAKAAYVVSANVNVDVDRVRGLQDPRAVMRRFDSLESVPVGLVWSGVNKVLVGCSS